MTFSRPPPLCLVWNPSLWDGVAHIQVGSFPLVLQVWKHPHRHALWHASYMIPDPIKLTVTMVSERERGRGIFSGTLLWLCLACLGVSFRSNLKRPSLDNPGYLPGQQHARDPTGAGSLRDALRKRTGEIHCPPRASTEQRLQRKAHACVSSEYRSRGPGSTTLVDVSSGDKSRVSLVGLSS